MVKLVVVYSKPDDVDAFEKHYFDVHLPLAKKMPGLVRWEIARGTGSPTPDGAYPYLTAQLYFEDRKSLDAAMVSEEGKASAKDLMGFAGRHAKLYFADVVEGVEVI